MKFEYLRLWPGNIMKLCSLDISNLDKLFLEVDTIKTYLDLYIDYREQLNQFDISKVVLVSKSQSHDISEKELRRVCIPIAQWPGSIITSDSNYQYQNYNFIVANNDNFDIGNLIDNKINIAFDSFYSQSTVNDQLRLLGSQIFIDIIVRSKVTNACRSLSYFDGIAWISDRQRLDNNFQYIELINDQVYFEPANF